jgi:protein-disulfide isomerase
VKLLIALALTFPLAAQQGITRNQADDQIIIGLDQPAPQGGSLLADPEHPDRVKVNIGGLPYIGVHDAPVTIVEFTDLGCLYCVNFRAETYRKIRHAFVETGKVRFVHWDLPLAINPHALFAAQVARCAREQEHFWEMRDWMGGHSQERLFVSERGCDSI